MLKISGLILLSLFKFLFAPSVVISNGYNFWETIVITVTGGWLGVFIFYYFGKILIILYFKYRKPKSLKIFSYKSRVITRIKMRFGIYGLAFFTPCLLSVPIGSILAARYYGNNKKTVYVLLGTVVLWSFILTTISDFFSDLL